MKNVSTKLKSNITELDGEVFGKFKDNSGSVEEDTTVSGFEKPMFKTPPLLTLNEALLLIDMFDPFSILKDELAETVTVAKIL